MQMRRIVASAVVTAVAFTFTFGLVAVRADEGGHDAAAGLPNCPVMGDEPVDLGVSIATPEGPVFFCCGDCIPKYKANPAKYATKVAAQRKALANRPKVQVVCPVTGEPVNPKISIQSEGRTVQFCCKGCVKKFKANPKKYTAALANSYTYQTKCPVMGEEIAPDSFAKTADGRTVYFCCKGCDKKFFANPAKYAAKLVSQGILIDPTTTKPAGQEEEHGHGG